MIVTVSSAHQPLGRNPRARAGRTAPAPDAETPEPVVETPQAAVPQQAKPESASETPQAAAPQQAESQPAVETPQPAEPKAEKSGSKKALGIIGAILAIVVIAGLKFGVGSAIGNFFNKDETADAKTGDCIAELPEVTGTEQEEVDGAKVVECTSTDAAYNVVGRWTARARLRPRPTPPAPSTSRRARRGTSSPASSRARRAMCSA